MSKEITFIALDGVDYCGKSTVGRELCDWLKECFDNGVRQVIGPVDKNLDVTRDLRDILVKYGMKLHDDALTSLMYTGFNLVCDVILNDAGENIWIVDRWISSNYVYQENADRAMQDAMANALRCRIGDPSFTIILDIDYDTYLARYHSDDKDKNYLDELADDEGRITFERRRAKYLEEGKKPNHIVVDATGETIDTVRSIVNILHCRKPFYETKGE